MRIDVHEKSGTFHLHNDELSYVMKVLPNGHLGQLYFGAPIHDREDFDYLLEICEYVVTVFIDGVAERKPICEQDRLAIIDAYKCECLGHIINWLNHGMSPELYDRFLRVCELRRGMTEELFDRSREGYGLN